MGEEETLNDILKTIDNKEYLYGVSFETLFGRYQKAENTIIERDHLDKIISWFEKEGYVLKLSVSPNYYTSTYKGRLFLKKGGFISQSKNAKKEEIIKSFTTFALIFGGVAAGCYYTYYILLYLYNFFFASY